MSSLSLPDLTVNMTEEDWNYAKAKIKGQDMTGIQAGTKCLYFFYKSVFWVYFPVKKLKHKRKH